MAGKQTSGAVATAIPCIEMEWSVSPPCVNKRSPCCPDCNLRFDPPWSCGNVNDSEKCTDAYLQLSLSINLKLAVIGWSDGSTSPCWIQDGTDWGKCGKVQYMVTPAPPVHSNSGCMLAYSFIPRKFHTHNPEVDP